MATRTHDLHDDRQFLAEESRAAADAVWRFLVPGYGPHGGHRLLDLGDDVQLLQSAASGLNEQALPASVVPFQDLAQSVRSAVGDQATAATLLASGLVRAGLEAEKDGVPRPAFLEGMRLARRQALATLDAASTKVDPTIALRHVSSLDANTVDLMVAGIRDLAQDGDGTAVLDDVDIRVESNTTPEWSEGLVAEPQHAPDAQGGSDVGVLVVDKGWSVSPRSNGVGRRIRDPAMVQVAVEEEASMRRRVLERLLDLGVGLIACGGDVDEDLCHALARAGIWVWTDAPKDARRRLVASTGARTVPDLDHLDGDGVGRADVRRRPRRRGDWWIIGPSPSATLLLPAQSPVMQASVADDGDRLLRAAGVVLLDPRAVPGGGRWQRTVAKALRDASVHAPGKHALAVAEVAKVFGAMADALIFNGGFDALDHPLLADAEIVLDPTPCVRAAVAAGFDAAATILRIDGRYDKRPSTPDALRGGGTKIGSPKGMPGDIPPHM